MWCRTTTISLNGNCVTLRCELFATDMLKQKVWQHACSLTECVSHRNDFLFLQCRREQLPFKPKLCWLTGCVAHFLQLNTLTLDGWTALQNIFQLHEPGFSNSAGEKVVVSRDQMDTDQQNSTEYIGPVLHMAQKIADTNRFDSKLKEANCRGVVWAMHRSSIDFRLPIIDDKCHPMP